jgi:hypothetical protein
MACVCVVFATRRSSVSCSSVSTTIVLRPTWSGTAVARTLPPRTAPRKLVVDPMVAVPLAPSGRLR